MFTGIGKLHKYDLWFVKVIDDEEFLKGCFCKIHVTQNGGQAASVLLVSTTILEPEILGNHNINTGTIPLLKAIVN